MQEMLYPTSYLKSKGLGKACALITDGRFSGGTSGLSIGHASPEAAEGGLIGLVEDGDLVEIDIPNRRIHLAVDDAEIARRRAAMGERGDAAWKPVEQRKRKVTHGVARLCGDGNQRRQRSCPSRSQLVWVICHVHRRWCSEFRVGAVGLSALFDYAMRTEFGIDHAVEDGNAEGGLGLLAGQLAGMQVVTEDALVACHRGFRYRPLAIAGFPLPARAPLLGNGLDVPVPL